MIRVLIADQVSRIVQDLERLEPFADEVDVCGIAHQSEAVIEEVWLRRPDVLVLHDSLADMRPYEFAQHMESVSPSTRVLVVTASAGMEAGNGVAAVVGETASGAELLQAIHVAIGLIPPGGTALEPPPSLPDPITPEPARRQRRAPSGRGVVVVVFSGKGGVGTSMIAANLAVAFAQEGEARAALLDVDLQFGDAAVILHVEGHLMSIEDLAQQAGDPDQALLDEALATGPGDVRVLRSPSSPELADLVTAGALRGVVRAAAREYAYVVVDTPSHLEERTLEVLELADRIIVVTSFNVTSVRSTKVSLRLLEALGIGRDRVDVILNQTRARPTFRREEIEEILRCRVLAELPYDPRVDESLDAGTPIVLTQPRSEISRRLLALATHLTPVVEEQRPVGLQPGQPAPVRLYRRRFSLGRR